MADVYTDVGEDFTVDQLDAFGTYYVAQGTGAGTHSKTSTTLFTESSESRVATTDTQPSSNVMQWVGSITADGSKTVTNAGIFDASSSGNLIVASDFTGISVTASDVIQYTFTLTFS